MAKRPEIIIDIDSIRELMLKQLELHDISIPKHELKNIIELQNYFSDHIHSIAGIK